MAYRRVVKVEMSFLDAFTMVALWVGQTEEALLEKGAVVYCQQRINPSSQQEAVALLTLFRSRRQKRCSGSRAYRRFRQSHLHPSDRCETGHGREGSLSMVAGESAMHRSVRWDHGRC